MTSLQGVAALLLAILATHQTLATSRAVNISSTWFLPQEGFPVFYRYFQDRITWFEADAVCQFHHANLVTVDNSVQYDAARAYLKELDIVNNVWIGLKRSGGSDDFTWTDYKALERNGGYWNEQIPKSASPLCAATDPAADFRWHSLNCGGPEVASFICEMPVPPWAHQEDGCMLTSLPSLTVIFLPELGAVELTSDCGQDGTRRIACKGQANREEMMRQLSCDYGGLTEDDGIGSAYPDVTSSSSVTSSSHRASTGQSSREWTGSSSAESHEMSGHGSRGWTGPSSSTGAWTGHFHEPPTRHRRDASSQMISLLGSTTSALSTDVSTDSSTVAVTSSEHAPKAGTTLKLEQTESGTHTTSDESRLSTTNDGWSSTVRDVDSTTVPEEFSSPTEEAVSMEKLKEQISTTQDVRKSSSSEPPLTTISVLNVSSGRITAILAEELIASSTRAAETSVSEASSTVKPTDVTNVTDINASQAEPSSTTDVPMPSTIKSSPSTKSTTDSPSSTTADDQMSGLNAQIKLLEPDENKSREEDEEERLKEEERKEEERRFREEEENRRRLFLPSPLRLAEIASETAASRAPPPPPVVEDAYEEPEEIVEPEPEIPSRPNRGRRLTRPQTHSFYPYFLNRVLG